MFHPFVLDIYSTVSPLLKSANFSLKEFADFLTLRLLAITIIFLPALAVEPVDEADKSLLER